MSLKTRYMQLDLPVPGITKGPTWAEMLNTIFEKIDQHNHTPGNGAPLSLDDISVSNDVDLSTYGIRNCGFLQLGYNYNTPNKNNTLFNYKGDLWYQYNTTGVGTGAFAQITSYDRLFTRSTSFEPLYLNSTNSPYFIDGLEKVSATFIDTSTGAITLNLDYSTNYSNGKFFLIQDMTGNASTNNITVTPQSTDSIGTGTAGTVHTINTDWGYVWIVAYGAGSVFPILTSA